MSRVPPEEVAARGEAIYERQIHPTINAEHHGKLVEDLANQFALGEDKHPEDITNATNMVVNYKNYVNDPNNPNKKKKDKNNNSGDGAQSWG